MMRGFSAHPKTDGPNYTTAFEVSVFEILPACTIITEYNVRPSWEGHPSGIIARRRNLPHLGLHSFRLKSVKLS